MTTVNVYNISGKKTGTVTVSDAVFACDSNDALLHQVTVAYAANRRQSTAHTKDRSERRGSGRKPWKQKGTGNARTGSVRNPIWRKGGVIFGPTSERNFTKDTTIKMRRKAMSVALSEKLRAETILVVENFDFAEHKTKSFAAMLSALKIDGSCVALLDTPEKDVALLSRNIPTVKSRSLATCNAHDIINHKIILISKDALEKLDARVGVAVANSEK